MSVPQNSLICRFRRPGSLLHRIGAEWQHYLLLLPAVVYLIIFSYATMYGVQIAFRDFRASKGILGSPWVGLKHFIRFVQYPDFGKILGNTLSITLYSLTTFPLGIILALMMNEVRNIRFKKTVQMITYAPHFISTVVVCSMITLFLNKNNGIINHVIAALGGTRIDFMTQSHMFPSIVVWSGVWQSIGWSTIIYISALSGVSEEMLEAARIDGANRIQIIWHMNIPTILPTIITMLILNCGNLLSLGFEKIYLLQNSLNLDNSQIIATYVYQVGLVSAQFSYSAAIGLFNNIINIALLLLVNAISKHVAQISLF